MAISRSWYFRDPALVVMSNERWNLREEHGCAACRHRDKDVSVFGKSICGIGKRPGKRGFCPCWFMDERWSNG